MLTADHDSNAVFLFRATICLFLLRQLPHGNRLGFGYAPRRTEGKISQPMADPPLAETFWLVKLLCAVLVSTGLENVFTAV